MIKSIVQIGDIHYRTLRRHQEYRAVSEAFFAHMRVAKPDRIVITGDIVHSRNQMTPELIDEVSWFLNECSKVAVRVVIIPGNHDVVEENMDRMNAIHPILEAIKCPNIDFYVKSALYPDENVVWAVYSIYDNQMMPKDLALKPYGLDKTYIGLYHGIVLGAKNNLGFEFLHGADLTTFDNCEITLCGDIHMRQILKSKPSGNDVIFCGSMIQQDHAETISGHGYCSITLGDKITYKFTDLINPVKYYTYQIKDMEDIFEGREVLINA